ncbi:MAG TPA: hypothetical protein VJB02_05600 [Coxiellaceae bacterium]|nr:hypothetical protein [Coxiellaceae bacterium]
MGHSHSHDSHDDPLASPAQKRRDRFAGYIGEGSTIVAALCIGVVAGFSTGLIFGWPLPLCIAIGVGGALIEGAVFWKHVKEGFKTLFRNPYAELQRTFTAETSWKERWFKYGLLTVILVLSTGIFLGFTSIAFQSFVEVFAPSSGVLALVYPLAIVGGIAYGVQKFHELFGYVRKNIFKEIKRKDFEETPKWAKPSKLRYFRGILLGMGLMVVMVISIAVTLGTATAWLQASTQFFHSFSFSQILMWSAVVPASILFAFKHSRKTVKLFIDGVGKGMRFGWGLITNQYKARAKAADFFRKIHQDPGGFVVNVVSSLFILGALAAHVFGEAAVVARGYEVSGSAANKMFGALSAGTGRKLSPAKAAAASKMIIEGATDLPFLRKRRRDVIRNTCLKNSPWFETKKPSPTPT